MAATFGVTDFRHPLAGVPSSSMAPQELAGVAEIAEILGVTRRTAARYSERDDFPAPTGQLARGRVWRRRDVEKWGAKHLPLPRPGRPPKS
jgi:predicted DNA-binding transcriptional regulator AlpA